MGGEFKTQRRVEFCETDAAGIAHFAAFFPYMEQAEHAFLRHLGLRVVSRDEEGLISWPRVSARCDYQGAAHFEDVLDVALKVAKLGTRSVTYAIEFSRDGQVMAKGSVTAVCCRVGPGQRLDSIDIPPAFREKLQPFVEGNA